MSDFTLWNDTAIFNRKIASIKTSAGNLNRNVHEAAYNFLAHADATGDIRPMVQLYNAVPPRMQVALRVWSVTFGKFRWSAAKGFGFNAKGKTNLAGAAEVSPFDYIKPKAERTHHDFDMAALKRLLDTAMNRANKAELSGAPITKLAAAIAAF